MTKFETKVYEYINEFDMLEANDKIVVGLSGGADSVCLLLVMDKLLNESGMPQRLVAVHINHHIRGKEADEDETFARNLADKLGIVFEVYHKDIKAMARELGVTVEEAGRKFRYECFNDAAKKHSCNKIAVAHNKNDLAETVIFNMVRGSGIKGLSGIAPKRDNIIRPLLDFERSEIEEYLASLSQDFRIDSTNETLDYDRNKIRHIILPTLAEINSKAVEHICQIANESADTYTYVHNKALEECGNYFADEDVGKTVSINVNEVFHLNQILQEHIAHEAICKVAGQKKDITRKHVTSVTKLLYQETGKQVELPYGIKARRSYDSIIISNEIEKTNDFRINITADKMYDVPEFGTLEISYLENNANLEISKKIYTKMIDYGKIKGNLCIRTPEEGDYIIIDSKGNSKKLTRVFIDNKIDRSKRVSWPVIACGKEIIWAIGLRYSEAYKVDLSTKRILLMNFIRKEGE